MGGSVKFDPLGDIRDVLGASNLDTPSSSLPTGGVTTSLGSSASSGGGTLEEDSKKTTIRSKKKGTQGLRINSTPSVQSAANQGVQI